ncbi:MAG: hypothetical protein ACPGJC_09575, partial [Pseudohongiellaceae bacterium]
SRRQEMNNLPRPLLHPNQLTANQLEQTPASQQERMGLILQTDLLKATAANVQINPRQLPKRVPNRPYRQHRRLQKPSQQLQTRPEIRLGRGPQRASTNRLHRQSNLANQADQRLPLADGLRMIPER